MSEFFVGQQVVVDGEGMGTIRELHEDDLVGPYAKVWIDGDPINQTIEAYYNRIRSYVDIYTQTNPAPKHSPNHFIGPFSDWIVKGMVTKWLDDTVYLGSNSPKNRDYPFDENDSFSWTVREMLDLEKSLNND